MKCLFTVGLVSGLLLSGCGPGEADGGAETAAPNYDPSVPCLRVEAGGELMLLATEHYVQARPESTIVVAASPREIAMRGTMDKDGASLALRFNRCLDVSQVNDLSFVMLGRPGFVEVALDSPSNLRPPEGECTAARCYSPRYAEFLEPPSTYGGAPWKSFENGAPSAVGDPEHVVGITWTVTGVPGDPVDLTILEPYVATLL